MSVKPCKDCGQPVSSSAKQCPHCGKPKPNGNPAAQLTGAAVLGLLIAGWYTSSDTEPDRAASTVQEAPKTPAQLASEQRRQRAGAATGYCRDVIEDNLHDPKSAEWEPSYKWPVSVSGDQLTVEVSLRANNAFGGKVFNTYTCVVEIQDNMIGLVSLE